MTGWLRARLAEWLAPDVFADARAYHRMRMIGADAYWWLGVEFPAAAAALRWLLDKDANERRPLGQPAVGHWPSQIGEFRERLRRGEHETAPAPPASPAPLRSRRGGV